MKHDHSWLNPYTEMLQGKMVLELGCGSGIDTETISKLTGTLVSCDLVPQQNGSCNVLILDHSRTLPFANDSFDTVVASLCLHYFGPEKTREIIIEISRILKSGGQMLCRVNSFKDENYGSVGILRLSQGYTKSTESRSVFY